MVIATRPGQTWDYILLRDRVPAAPPPGASPEEVERHRQEAERIKAHQTVWKLGSLSLADRAALEDQIGQVDIPTRQFTTNAGTNTLTILRIGLKAADNWQVDDGAGGTKPVEWQNVRKFELGRQRDVPADGILELIDPDDRKELANAITEGQRLSTEEKKG